MTTPPRQLGWLVPLLLALVLVPGIAGACAIDDRPSLSANGVRASINLVPATDLARWAPFSVIATFASNAPIRLTENHADLVRSLPATTVAAPYRWSFGDGANARGHVAVHRYTSPGTYKVTIYGLYGSADGPHTWVPFDSVLLQIVAPHAPLPRHRRVDALAALDTAPPVLRWAMGAAIVLGVLSVLLISRRPSRRSA